MIRHALAALLLLASSPPARAQRAAGSEDRAATDACLARAKDTPETCIGTIYKICTEAPGGSSTAGMGDCAGRETAMWQEKIDASLRELRAGALGATEAAPWNRPPGNARDKPVPGTDILDDMERAWAAWRTKKCDALSMKAEGGSLSRVLYGSCFYDETARHALWLKSLVEDTQPH